MVRQSARITLLLVAATLSGCGGDDLSRFKEGLVPVTGKVTLDGRPLEGAGVLFVPKSAASFGGKLEVGTRIAMGETDAEGKYSLISPPHGEGVRPEEYPGCLPGEYGVMLLQDRGAGVVAEDNQPEAPTTTQKIPEKFFNPLTSGMKATVDADGGDDFNFELKSK